MTRAIACAALLTAACSQTPTSTPTGEFNSPTGISSVSAGDRDLLLIANSGRDSLRALQVCNRGLLDGGVDPKDTCATNQDLQFVPAAIRVFPAAVETQNRVVRVAGARVLRNDGQAAGVGLAVGSSPSVAVIDAYSLAQAPLDAGIPNPVQQFALGTPDAGPIAVDVVAANPLTSDSLIETASDAGPVTAYVATVAPPQLISLAVGLDANNAPQVTENARCNLDPAVVPAKIAVAPGTDADVYIADLGADGGIVHVAKANITGASCAEDRIVVANRRVRSVAASPPWFEPASGAIGETPHPAGELLLAVLEPLTCSGTSPECAATPPGQDPDPGGVVFVRTTDRALVPIPPFDLMRDTTNEKMQPLSPPTTLANAFNGNPTAWPLGGLVQEGTFLRAVKPAAAPVPPDVQVCPAAPCTPIYVGVPSGTTTKNYALVAAVTSTDGATYLIDVVNRRWVNPQFLDPAATNLLPTTTTPPTLTPAQTNGPPVPTLASMQPGVTHSAHWRVIWHSPLPNLDRRAGLVKQIPGGSGTLLFQTAPANLNLWTDDPAIQLAPGDVVSFGSYSVSSDPSPPCQAFVSKETSTPFRFELPIVSIAPDSMVLGAPDASLGFDASSCQAFGVVAQVRAARTQPWLVFQNFAARGRAAPDGTFTSHERRWDYPLNYTTDAPPTAANDVGLSFTVTGAPSTAGAGFLFDLSAGPEPVIFRDTAVIGGFATAVYAYSSPRRAVLIFSSVTGANEVIQADPTQVETNATAYR